MTRANEENTRWQHVTFISAGAGSGKTYRLTKEIEQALAAGAATPAGIVGTTFTVKAATELRERVRARLLNSGRLLLAEQTAESLIGTVHSVCERLLTRFAFELGLTPELNVLSADDGAHLFNQALDEALEVEQVRQMNAIAQRLFPSGQDQPSWQTVAKNLADQARENDIDADALRRMGERNAADLLAFYPEPGDSEPTGELLRRVSETIDNLPVDAYQGARKYQELLIAAQSQLGRDDCPWSVWMRLAGYAGIKAIAEQVAYVQEVAELYEGHARFHRDLDEFMRGVFAIAADSLARFQQLKREQRFIDFADMEQLALHALDEGTVRSRLAGELELLVVDEFQDTNPMQLALFLKLARLADRAIFVGDEKQAIYAFRGCDPELVSDTLDGLAAGGAARDKLAASWRSRPALVQYANELFAAAFVGDGIERESVTLDARREEIAGPAVTAWTLAGSKAEQRARAVAEGIVQLVDGAEQIVDSQTSRPRPIAYGDIAVLARTNDAVARIAASLHRAQVPMKRTLAGLQGTPEIALAKACLRRLADRADTLATAEIVTLADGAEPEAWLANRLDWLAANGDALGWREDDHPIVRRLHEMRDEVALRSPVETVARVLNEADIRRLVAAWGPDEVRVAQRQKNLDAFLDLAIAYEQHALSHREPGTLAGFLLWLEQTLSPELDQQPVAAAGNAVHVLTYHRAKGLEWPVVVCTDFDHSEPLRIWNVRVKRAAAFSLDAPLANRELRYWPGIYGGRKNGVPTRKVVEESCEGLQCRRQAVAEQRRLAYVGITRARDRLALALQDKKLSKDAWMQSFKQDFALPSGTELILPSGATIPTRAEKIEADDGERAPPPYRPRWFVRRERIVHPRKFVQPSSASPVADAAIGEMIEVGQRIPLRGDDMADVGAGLHAVIAAELVNPLPLADAVDRASELLAAHNVHIHLDAADAIVVASRFRRCLEDLFGVSRIEAEVPVVHRLDDGRVVRGAIDALAETARGWLIVDHKSSPQRRSTWRGEARKHSGQLRMYQQALTAAGQPVAGCYIHFAVTGGLVGVRLPDPR